jgi:hypothetical protein
MNKVMDNDQDPQPLRSRDGDLLRDGEDPVRGAVARQAPHLLSAPTPSVIPEKAGIELPFFVPLWRRGKLDPRFRRDDGGAVCVDP